MHVFRDRGFESSSSEVKGLLQIIESFFDNTDVGAGLIIFLYQFVVIFNTYDKTYSLGPVYEFVCDSFRTGNLNCFRVK